MTQTRCVEAPKKKQISEVVNYTSQSHYAKIYWHFCLLKEVKESQQTIQNFKHNKINLKEYIKIFKQIMRNHFVAAVIYIYSNYFEFTSDACFLEFIILFKIHTT